MIGFLLRMIGGVFTPLIDQVSDFGARLLRKAALFVVALLCLNVVLIALTLAFGMWIASLSSAIVGVLAVAGLYLAIAVVAILLALRKPKAAAQPAGKSETAAEAKARSDLDGQVDDFTAPLLGILQSLGLRREQFAVLAGASVAKKLGPMPLVGLAIVAGFLIGRTYRSWASLMSIDTLTTVLAAAGLFGFGATDRDDPSDESDKKAA